jgi:hypothetical protein
MVINRTIGTINTTQSINKQLTDYSYFTRQPFSSHCMFTGGCPRRERECGLQEDVLGVRERERVVYRKMS